jgi:ABC-type transporter Mla subunit MlaD
MKRRLLAAALLLLPTCQGEKDLPKPGGALVHVLFDERQDLEGGEPVRFHDFEVGRVEKVDIAQSRVRATLSIDPKVASQLTRESTFSVESDDSGIYLLAHVFDPDAEKLEEGGTLEGVDSGVELALREASSEASRILSRIGSSEWVQQAKGVLSELERELQEIDWGQKEKQVREELEEARKSLDEAAGETSQTAKEAYQELRRELDRLVTELEKLGRSEQARKLKDRVDELFGPESEER